MRHLIVFVGMLLISIGSVSAATVNYMEDPDGEFSGEHDAPTDLGVLGIGNNIIAGTVTEVGLDFMIPDYLGTADVFTFEVPTGTRVDEIFLRRFSSTSNLIFIGIDDADTFFFSPENINSASGLNSLQPELVTLGTIGESDDVDNPAADPDGGANLFDVLVGSANSFGPGNYSVYLQETGDSSDYTLNFRVVSAVPEPSALALMSLLSLAAVCPRKRKPVRV